MRDWQTCDPEHRVPVLNIHGHDDDVVGMTGDPVTGVPSMPALLGRWADWNGVVRNESANSYSNGYLTHYFDWDGKLVAKLAALSEAGHDWPIGFDDRYYSSGEIWRFFDSVAHWLPPNG